MARDAWLLALAVQRGWITAEQARSARPPEAWLTPDQIAELTHEHDLARRALDVGFLGAEDLMVAGRQSTAAPGSPDPAPGGPDATVLLDGAATVAEQSAGDDASDATTPGDDAGARFGKYRLLEELGRGGMGVVHRALDLELNREVALKTLPTTLSADETLILRLLREARTAAALEHPGIPPIYDVGVSDGRPYFAMAYVRGSTLDRLVDSGALPELRQRAAIVHAAAEAVAHAHARKVVHRDLKPANIMVGDDGRVQVMDFGLAKNLEQQTRLTATGQMLGTPSYMPPEQIDGALEKIGPHTDVYGLGAVLYFALTGHPPFEGSSLEQVIVRALERDPEPPRRRNSRVPADLETICLVALHKDPERRYPTAREFAADLGRYLAGEAVLARPERRWAKLARWARRRKALCALIAGVFLAAHGASLQAWRARAAAASRTELQQELGDTLEQTAALSLDAVLALRRLGGRRSQAQASFVAPLADAARQLMTEAPESALPHYHLGRIHRATMRFDDALAEQDRALVADARSRSSRHERVALLAQAHAARMRELRDRWRREESRRLRLPGANPSARPIPLDRELGNRDPELDRIRRRIVSDLELLLPGTDATASSRPDGSDAPNPPTPAMPAAARGLLAFHSAADAAMARTWFEEAVRTDPTLEEAQVALAALEQFLGRTDAAVAVLGRALEVDRGYVPFWIQRGEARRSLAARMACEGHDASEAYALAGEDYGQALELDPECVEAWLGRAEIRASLAGAGEAKGKDPLELYSQAEADCTRAQEIAPHASLVLVVRAAVREARGDYRSRRGEDSEPDLALADADLTRAVQLDDRGAETWTAGGRFHFASGRRAVLQGVDPEESHARAEKELEEALALDPTCVQAWLIRGLLHAQVGDRAADPADRFRRSEADFGQAIVLAPAEAEPRWRRASLRGAMGRWKEAAADYAAALELDPSCAQFLAAPLAIARAHCEKGK